jgi:hypothetical protein
MVYWKPVPTDDESGFTKEELESLLWLVRRELYSLQNVTMVMVSIKAKMDALVTRVQAE